jgi:hypothetical protein
MAVVDKLVLKDPNNTDVEYDIGASAQNVSYTDGSTPTTVKGKLDSINTNHINVNVLGSEAHGIRSVKTGTTGNEKYNVEVKDGNNWYPISSGLPETPLSIQHGGTGNTSGYVRAGAASGSTIGTKATAEGEDTQAEAYASHAEGYQTKAIGFYSHAEGWQSTASADYSHAEGKAFAFGSFGHAENTSTVMDNAEAAHAEGVLTRAEGVGSHSEGGHTIAGGDYSHAEGSGTTASKAYSHAEGENTTASGEGSHAEGKTTVASNEAAHAEGGETEASGAAAHAEGIETTAQGMGSHSEGRSTLAIGNYSHAGGNYTTAAHNGSFVHGIGTENNHLTAYGVGSFVVGDNSEVKISNYDSEIGGFCFGISTEGGCTNPINGCAKVLAKNESLTLKNNFAGFGIYMLYVFLATSGSNLSEAEAVPGVFIVLTGAMKTSSSYIPSSVTPLIAAPSGFSVGITGHTLEMENTGYDYAQIRLIRIA